MSRKGFRHRVLVVDDEPGMRELARASLEAAGYAVCRAQVGLQAPHCAHTARVAPAMPTKVSDHLPPEMR